MIMYQMKSSMIMYQKKALPSLTLTILDVFVCLALTCRQGELYFELHRGTYTSHAANKAFNRRCELLLREVEVAASLAMVANKDYAFPGPEVAAIWQVGGSALVTSFWYLLLISMPSLFKRIIQSPFVP